MATVLAPRAWSTTANDLCAPTADPCVVSTNVLATAGSVIDVGQRELQIIGSGQLRVNGGNLTLRGRRISSGPSTTIQTTAGRNDPAGSLVITAQQVVITGTLNVSGSPAGSLDVDAVESIAISGTLQGRSESSGSSSSVVSLTAPTVVLSGQVLLNDRFGETGGDIFVTADTIVTTANVNVDGGDGGSFDLNASASIVITAAATISANATTFSGDGGEIIIRSDGTLNMAGRLTANGRSGPSDGGGDGGMIVLAGDEGVILPVSGVVVRANAGSPDGSGGDIEVSSLAGSVEIHGTVDASGGDSNDTVGGTVDISAETTVDIAGSVLARGALSGGGEIEIDAGDWVRVRSGAQVDASSTRSAVAGAVAVLAGTSIEVFGSVLANSAQTNAGTGGTISLDACSISIRSGSELRCRGPRGTTVLTAAGAIVVSGTIASGPSEASNRLLFPQEGPAPVLTGANISPAATLQPDPAVIPCVPLPPTPTPPATSSPTPSLTPPPSLTPTPTPPQLASPTPQTTATVPGSCAGDCDGNGTVSIAELIRAVNIALGNDDAANCRAADTNGDGRVTINELIQAVNAALLGCGA